MRLQHNPFQLKSYYFLLTLAFLLDISLNAQWLIAYKPSFTGIALIYGVVRGFGGAYFLAVLCGLLLDVAYFSPIGLHVLYLASLCWVVYCLRIRVMWLSTLAQTPYLLFILVVGQVTLFGLSKLDGGEHSLSWVHFTPALVGTIVWIFVPAILSNLRTLLAKLLHSAT